MSNEGKGKGQPLYSALIAEIFRRHYRKKVMEFEFSREEIIQVAQTLGLALPKNVGDVLYSFKFRKDLPESIRATERHGLEWCIESAGRAVYRFRLCPPSRIIPRTELATIKIPDATPEIISVNALNDEQALLAKVRYNRLIDIFLRLTAYSLQNHLRTTVKGVGQIEIDELYVGLNRAGAQFIIPVQAKGGTDQLGTVQARQDIACCAEKFPWLVCRAVAAQFMTEDRIAMFELAAEDDNIVVVEERHYKLVPANTITEMDLTNYASRSDE